MQQLEHFFFGDHCAFIQVSDPVSLTATSVKKMRRGLPSAVPRFRRQLST